MVGIGSDHSNSSVCDFVCFPVFLQESQWIKLYDAEVEYWIKIS